jgi:hypothetical protein
MGMQPRHLRCCVAMCVAALGGCSGIPGTSSGNVIIPNETLNISRSASYTAEGLVAGALIFIIVDPLAPNWQIEQTTLDAGRYRIAMKKKRFTTGGDGEAAQVFFRRATQLAREQGNGRYRVVEFTEGIESSVPFAQRVAQGIVDVMPKPPANARATEAINSLVAAPVSPEK